MSDYILKAGEQVRLLADDYVCADKWKAEPVEHVGEVVESRGHAVRLRGEGGEVVVPWLRIVRADVLGDDGGLDRAD